MFCFPVRAGHFEHIHLHGVMFLFSVWGFFDEMHSFCNLCSSSSSIERWESRGGGRKWGEAKSGCLGFRGLILPGGLIVDVKGEERGDREEKWGMSGLWAWMLLGVAGGREASLEGREMIERMSEMIYWHVNRRTETQQRAESTKIYTQKLPPLIKNQNPCEIENSPNYPQVFMRLEIPERSTVKAPRARRMTSRILIISTFSRFSLLSMGMWLGSANRWWYGKGKWRRDYGRYGSLTADYSRSLLWLSDGGAFDDNC